MKYQRLVEKLEELGNSCLDINHSKDYKVITINYLYRKSSLDTIDMSAKEIAKIKMDNQYDFSLNLQPVEYWCDVGRLKHYIMKFIDTPVSDRFTTYYAIIGVLPSDYFIFITNGTPNKKGIPSYKSISINDILHDKAIQLTKEEVYHIKSNNEWDIFHNMKIIARGDLKNIIKNYKRKKINGKDLR